MEKSQMYSPTQIGLGAFLGGPFAAIYFLRKNFQILKKESEAKQTLLWGLMFSAIIIAVIPFLPENFPSMVIPLAYLIPTIQVAKSHQLSKDAIVNSDEFDFRSNWNVFGIGLALMILFYAVTVAVLFSLMGLGMVDAPV